MDIDLCAGSPIEGYVQSGTGAPSAPPSDREMGDFIGNMMSAFVAGDVETDGVAGDNVEIDGVAGDNVETDGVAGDNVETDGMNLEFSPQNSPRQPPPAPSTVEKFPRSPPVAELLNEAVVQACIAQFNRALHPQCDAWHANVKKSSEQCIAFFNRVRLLGERDRMEAHERFYDALHPKVYDGTGAPYAWVSSEDLQGEDTPVLGLTLAPGAFTMGQKRYPSSGYIGNAGMMCFPGNVFVPEVLGEHMFEYWCTDGCTVVAAEKKKKKHDKSWNVWSCKSRSFFSESRSAANQAEGDAFAGVTRKLIPWDAFCRGLLLKSKFSVTSFLVGFARWARLHPKEGGNPAFFFLMEMPREQTVVKIYSDRQHSYHDSPLPPAAPG
jgi:hypothetical protein